MDRSQKLGVLYEGPKVESETGKSMGRVDSLSRKVD